MICCVNANGGICIYTINNLKENGSGLYVDLDVMSRARARAQRKRGGINGSSLKMKITYRGCVQSYIIQMVLLFYVGVNL